MTEERTWTYIADKSEARKHIKQIEKYADQDYISDAGIKEHTKLAFDVETFRPDGNRHKFPRPIWNGREYESQIRIWAVGTDPTLDLEYCDRQFLFDAVDLGMEWLADGFREMFESKDLLMQAGQYELMHLRMLDIEPQYRIDTMLMSQIINQGDHMFHGLADLYEHAFWDNKQLFFELSGGIPLHEYASFKDTEQHKYWGGPLKIKDLKYSSHDVRMIFYVMNHLFDRLEDFASRETQKRSIMDIVKLEFALMSVFTSMEQMGIKIDIEKLKETVIPLCLEMIARAREQLLLLPEFRRKVAQDVVAELWFKSTVPNALKDGIRMMCVKDKEREFGLTEQIKAAMKKHLNLAHRAINVTGKEMAGGDLIQITIKADVDKNEFFKLARKMLPRASWELQPTDMINLNAPEQVVPALNKAFKRFDKDIEVANSRADYLQTIVDKHGEQACEPILYLMHYKEAKDFNVKFGQGLQRHVTQRGFVHAHIHQMGNERAKEVATGRSAISEPPLQQMPNNKELFTYDADLKISAAQFIREIFIAQEGNVFVNCDFSQIEPRYTAWVTGCPNMRRIFQEGRDQHEETARLIFGKGKDDPINQEERSLGKRMNLGKQYLMSDRGLADRILIATKGVVNWTKNNYKISHYAQDWNNHIGKGVTIHIIYCIALK